MSRATTRVAARKRRHTSIRLTVEGSAARPRLAIFRSLNHIYAQVIDDQRGATLAAASTLDTAAKGDAKLTKVQEAAAVGTLIGERAKAVGVAQVVVRSWPQVWCRLLNPKLISTAPAKAQQRSC